MKLKLICILALVLYLPSLFNYFSHDDFFNLQLAGKNSIGDFIRFFDIFHAPDRLGSYRPLTTQVYFLTSRFFNFSSLPLHIIAFVFFFLDIYLVYKLSKLILRDEKASLISAFLYAVSATHFAHLYWPSIFQETGLVFFFLLCVLLFLQNRFKLAFWSMIGGFMSKETAIMIPAVLTLVIYLKGSWRNFWKLIPYYIATGIFLFIHLTFYGLPPGNVYKLDFSLKILNTFMWYVLWVFNLPELFVDYIGPGFHFNFNLIRFYGPEVVAILFFFITSIASFALALKKTNYKLAIFCFGWFLVTLIPVIFLPWHKFTYELGVPLVGIILLIGHLLSNTTTKLAYVFCIAWFLTSFLTLNLTIKTHWITNGPKVAKRVEEYFLANKDKINSNVAFYDTPGDELLPWSPANEMKIDLSNQDFFTVYYPEKFKVSYLSKLPDVLDRQTTYIGARQFLGY